MTENTYRLAKVILLAIFVAGSLVIAYRFSENGRYVQYDKRRTYSPDGKERMVTPAYMIFDTRTGKALSPPR
jgi:hypothetical protein